MTMRMASGSTMRRIALMVTRREGRAGSAPRGRGAGPVGGTVRAAGVATGGGVVPAAVPVGGRDVAVREGDAVPVDVAAPDSAAITAGACLAYRLLGYLDASARSSRTPAAWSCASPKVRCASSDSRAARHSASSQYALA